MVTKTLQTDRTSLFLIGAVAAPVAQHLVDGSVLAFTEANISFVLKFHYACVH